jgi:hypothetical protein
VRTTLNLDDDVARAAKSLARASGRGLGEVVSELMRRGLRSRNAGRRIPTFVVGEHAKTIPSGRARRLLAGLGP